MGTLRVSEETPSHLVIINRDGIFSIDKTDLPPDLQERFPPDPAAARAQEETRASNAAALEAGKREIVAERLARTGLTFTPARSARLIPRHDSFADLAARAEKEARNLDLGAETIAKRIAAVPAGGWLSLTVESFFIHGANTENFTVIVYDGTGTEIARARGADDIANTPRSNGKWWNMLGVDLPKLDSPPYRIRVVDSVSGNAVDFRGE